MTVFDANCIYTIKCLALIFVAAPGAMLIGALLIYLCEWCGRLFTRKKNEKKCEACRKEGRYGSPQMVAHSKREPPKVSINGVLKIADKDGTTYGKAVLAHNI